MKLNFTPLIIIVILITISLPMEGKRVAMVPLTAREVYRMLRAAGREDAVPEGRVVTQGIAAVTGFAVGLAKGIGGSLLFDLAVANGLLGGLPQTQQVQTQEVCFSSRSLNEIYDGEDEDVAQGRQAGTTTTPTGTTPTYTTPTTNTNTPTTQVANPTTTITLAPTTTGTNTNNGDGTYVDNGDDTGTATDTTTQTGTGGAVNCVVIQQPPSSTANKAG